MRACDVDGGVWQGPMWNDCGACNYFRRSSDDGRRYCAWCSNIAMERMRTLAGNLEIAGALCHSWHLRGRLFLYHDGKGNVFQREWWPGCGRDAP